MALFGALLLEAAIVRACELTAGARPVAGDVVGELEAVLAAL